MIAIPRNQDRRTFELEDCPGPKRRDTLSPDAEALWSAAFSCGVMRSCTAYRGAGANSRGHDCSMPAAAVAARPGPGPRLTPLVHTSFSTHSPSASVSTLLAPPAAAKL